MKPWIKLTALIAIASAKTITAGAAAEAGSPGQAATAINALGIDLLSKTSEPGESVLLSPYSIQTALAMTFAGADGDTRREMARVLHYGEAQGERLHASFAALRNALEEFAQASAQRAEMMKQYGPTDPFTLTIANRLYGQQGYDFRKPFLSLTAETYKAPFQAMDFVNHPTREREKINQWVEGQTTSTDYRSNPAGWD